MPTTHTSVPTHLGLILDGNRRWAREHGLPTMEGHKKGYENLKNVAQYAFKQGVKYVSAYVFSTENWKRSAEEVDYLMKLLIWVSRHEIKELDKENIRVQFLGEEERLSQDVISAMESAEKRTKDNTGGTLLICLNYGGHQEIATAMNKILIKNPGIQEVTQEMIEKHLYKPDVPTVDMIIRTSGEQRISNFMLWRAAYSELYFTNVHWPAFSEQDLQLALDNFAARQRRFGS